MWADLQTIQMSYQEIVNGEQEWNALGDFMNYWFGYATDRREDLMRDPIEEPADVSNELHAWATFCAASVEFLCAKYEVPCPAWVHNPSYILAEPWYRGLGADKPHIQERLKQESPEAFKKRNIYCSSNIFANKYELAAKVQKLRQQRTA